MAALIINTPTYKSCQTPLLFFFFFFSRGTYSAEVFGSACFSAVPAPQQHVLQLVSQPSQHLRGVNLVIGKWAVVAEVQQAEEPRLAAVPDDGHALLHQCVVRVHEVHPVAAVVQVVPGQRGHAEHILIAEGDGWEGHVVSPHHVDLCDGWVGHHVHDPIPRPRAQETDAHKEGHDPGDSLQFVLVRGEDELQTVDLGPSDETHRDLLPRRLPELGLVTFEGRLLSIRWPPWTR